MNAPQDDTHWQALSGILRQVLGRGPFTLAEAQAVFDATPAAELSADAVDTLIARSTLPLLNGSSKKQNGFAHLNGDTLPRKLIHEPLERRDLLTPLFDWFCGTSNETSMVLPPAPRFTTACYAAAW